MVSEKSLKRLKSFGRSVLGIIDRILWVVIPPYGLFIAFRHVRQHWEHYRVLSSSGALLLAERAGMAEDERDKMLARMNDYFISRDERVAAKRERRKAFFRKIFFWRKD